MNEFVQKQLDAIAAKKAAAQAAQPVPAAPEPAPAAPKTSALVKPPDCPQEVWDTAPPDVQALIVGGAAGQAVPVNPPEASQGIIESASGAAAKPAEDKPKGRGRGKAKPVDPSPTDALLLEEIKGIRAALDAQTEALQGVAQAILGAAEILAG